MSNVFAGAASPLPTASLAGLSNTDSLLAFKARADAGAHDAADALVQLSEEMGFDR